MPQAYINLASLSHNVRRLRSRLEPGVQMLAAVKANAYGHGALPVAQHLAAQGVSWFGVATAAEAAELRAGNIAEPILIFSPVYEGVERLAEGDIRFTVADEASLRPLESAKLKGANVHLKVDTGMSRLGLSGRDAVALAQRIDASPHTVLEGVWTHFANADDDSGATRDQLERFHAVLDELAKEGLEPPLIHAANSAAVITYPAAQFDLVRPGIALYGYHSSPYVAGLEPALRPVMTLTAPVTFVKRVAAGTPVSYGSLWRAPKPTTVLTVRMGYADGYPRLLTGRSEVTVQGQLRPLVGRVCMDQLMVDAGDLDVAVGERVTLFGPGPLTAEVLAERVGTIAYEVLSGVGSRVERHYTT